jgi:hypothetical protein
LDEIGSTSFLFSKLCVGAAAMSLLALAFSMASGLNRAEEGEELSAVADSISGALRMADGMPGEVSLVKELPTPKEWFQLELRGTFEDDLQFIQISLLGEGANVEQITALSRETNGGDFYIKLDNPSSVRIFKDEEITLEVL